MQFPYRYFMDFRFLALWFYDYTLIEEKLKREENAHGGGGVKNVQGVGNKISVLLIKDFF